MTTAIKPHKISRREWLAVIALLLIAFALRTAELMRVPPGLHNDEVAFAEITETVTHGRLAIFFPENIGNEGLAYYFAAPFMDVLGLNVLAIRLPAVFISLIAAALIWALARRWFGPVAALAALAAFSVTFWPVAFGRIGLHVVMMVPLATLAAYSIWRAQAAHGRRVKVWWALSGVCIGLAIDTYTAARILPAILMSLWRVHPHRTAGRVACMVERYRHSSSCGGYRRCAAVHHTGAKSGRRSTRLLRYRSPAARTHTRQLVACDRNVAAHVGDVCLCR